MQSERPAPYLGLVTSAFFRWDDGSRDILSDVGRLVRDPDVRVLEIGPLPGREVSLEVAEVMAANGVARVYSGYGPFSSRSSGLLCPNEQERAQALYEARAIIDEAVACGAKVLALAPGRAPDLPADVSPCLDRLGQSLAQLGRYADQLSDGTLYLAIETMDRNIHRRQILSQTREAASFIARVRLEAPHIGLLLDLSHIPMVGEDIEDAVSAAAGALVHMHAGNCVMDPGHPLYGDSHPPFGIHGGVIGQAQVVRYLTALGVTSSAPGRRAMPFGFPVISLEIVTPDGDCPFETVAAAKRVYLEAAETAFALSM